MAKKSLDTLTVEELRTRLHKVDPEAKLSKDGVKLTKPQLIRKIKSKKHKAKGKRPAKPAKKHGKKKKGGAAKKGKKGTKKAK